MHRLPDDLTNQPRKVEAWLRLWANEESSEQRDTLESLLAEGVTRRDVDALVDLHGDMAELRRVLDWYAYDAVPPRLAEPHRLGEHVHGLFTEKERSFYTHMDRACQEFEGVTGAAATPEQVRDARRTLDEQLTLLALYDGERAYALTARADAANAKLQGRQTRRRAPGRRGEAEREGRRRQAYEEVRDELEQLDPQENGAHKELKRIRNKLITIANVAADRNYAHGAAANDTLRLASTMYQQSRSAYEKRFYLKLTAAVTGLAASAFFTLGAVKMYYHHKLEDAIRAPEAITEPVQKPLERRVQYASLAPPGVEASFAAHGAPYVIHVEKDANTTSVYERGPTGITKVFSAKSMDGAAQGPKTRAGDRRTPEGDFAVEEVTALDGPLYGAAFVRIASRHRGLGLFGTGLAERDAAIDEGRDASNGGVILHDRDVLQVARYARASGTRVLIEDGSRPVYGGGR